ncbi:small ribosomal subunit Rsm22 family protein [Estrella lausannensis]|uniref:Methyltransferase, Rsm22 family n=1 Tax=Estrella lausannensis TaxID=483423 RepID=A0A0H5DP20_9BACT|nr:small ribosomal subunit Rsm22 family protein [Estrella lausannensis]CRX38221.1 Methyltransferase, Rsm22 family [Estrella lausannensis]
MHLPRPLQLAIEKAADTAQFKQLSTAREELTRRYQQPAKGQFMTTKAERLSYLISRMPATFAAVSKALESIRERANLSIRSLADLGAGPGTASWAFAEYFPELEEFNPVEMDRELQLIGKQLAQSSDREGLRRAVWQESNLEKVESLPPADAVVFSYSVGELKQEILLPLIDRAWESAGQLLLIVEPGTPAGFERIRSIRQHLIDKGAFLIAPCPHPGACPMTGSDWCHFAARVERSSLHRRIKGGTMGFEDEKFSYVAAVKQSVILPGSRILAGPEIHSGHVTLKLCTLEGLKRETISKKRGELYKLARKAEWGSSLP